MDLSPPQSTIVSELTLKEKVELFKEEYIEVLKIVDSFDSKALKVKEWSVTVSLTGISAAFWRQEPRIILVAGASSFMFWIIEARWKSHQSCFYTRLQEIEECLRGEQNVFPLHTREAWIRLVKRKTTWKRIFSRIWSSHICIPYAPIIVLSLLMYFFY